MSFFNLVLLAVIFCVSMICALWDIRKMKVPDFVIFAGIAAVIFCNLIFKDPGMHFSFSRLMQIALTGFSTGLFYFAVRLICHGRLGKGDVLFGIFQGVCLMPEGMIFCLAAEVLSAALFILIRKMICRNQEASFSEKIPFVPFMVAGLLFSFIIINFFMN